MEMKEDKIAIIGAGLVGAACACMLSKRGFKVDLLELREDLRQLQASELSVGRSINLALSVRGQETLRFLGLEEEIIKNHAIPMYARMIHNLDGTTNPIPYGKKGQCIYSVGRRFLLEQLLNLAGRDPNVRLLFKHKLLRANLEQGEVVCSNGKDQQTLAGFKAILGCDGAFSRLRQDVVRRGKFYFEQKYIEHGYVELCIPAKNGQFQMAVNYLHIWPRGEFMMIALPNQDCSYTVTLFMPFAKFEALSSPEKILDFFRIYFPDSVPLIGEQSIVSTLTSVPAGSLVSIKCSPYHVGGRALLLGDAAHAMVPFYGQGMNCGFEDVLILNNLLGKSGKSASETDLAEVFAAFSANRTEDAHAIVELALYNYIEMRDLVNSRLFKLRKKFDGLLHFCMPQLWVPLYTSVTFSRMGYAKCIANREWQDKILTRISKYAMVGTLATMALFAGRWAKTHPDRVSDVCSWILSKRS